MQQVAPALHLPDMHTVHDSMLAFSELVPYSAAPEALEFNINPRLLILNRRISLLPLVYLSPGAYFNLHNYSVVNLWWNGFKKWRLSAHLLIKISLVTGVSLYCSIFCCCGFWHVHFRLAWIKINMGDISPDRNRNYKAYSKSICQGAFKLQMDALLHS